MISVSLYKILFIIAYLLSEFIVMIATGKWYFIGNGLKIIIFIALTILNAIILYFFYNSCENIKMLQDIHLLTKDEEEDFSEILLPKLVGIEFSGSDEDEVSFENTDIKFSKQLFCDEYSTEFIARALNKNIFNDLRIVSVSTGKECAFFIPRDSDKEITLLYLLTENGLNHINFTKNYIDLTYLVLSIINSDTENFAVLLAHKHGDETETHKLFAVAKNKDTYIQEENIGSENE